MTYVLMIVSVASASVPTVVVDAADTAAAQQQTTDRLRPFNLPGSADGPGFAYIDTLINDLDATYDPILLRDNSWYDKQVRLTPAFQALLSAAVSYFTGGAGLGVTGVFQKAALDSLITGSISGAITGNFDLEDILKGALLAGSSAFVSDFLTTRFNLGTQLGISNSNPIVGDIRQSFMPGVVLDRLGDRIISSSVANLFNGRPIFEGMSNLARDFVVGETLARVQFQIGSLGLREGSLQHFVLHGLAGCAAAEALKADCIAGAASGAAQSLYAGTLSGSNLSDLEQQERVKLIGALVGYALSGGSAENVSVSIMIAYSGIVNNRQLHRLEGEWIRENAAEFARQQCLKGNCISLQTAIEQLTLQAGRNVDSNLASGTSHNSEAQAFFDANAPKGIIPGTAGSRDYIDTNQTWFTQDVDQFNNHLINFAHISANSDLYHVFADVQSAQGGNIDIFKTTLFISSPSQIFDLSPSQKIGLLQDFDATLERQLSALTPDLIEFYSLSVGQMGEAVVRELVHSLSDSDWASLSVQDQEYLAGRVFWSYFSTITTVPGGDGGAINPNLSYINSAQLRANVTARFAARQYLFVGRLNDGRMVVSLPDGRTGVLSTAGRFTAAPVHHICTNKNCVSYQRGGPWTPRYQVFFDRSNYPGASTSLSIDKASENLVSVPGHFGPHPEAYNVYVFDQLTEATAGIAPYTPQYRAAVTNALDDIAIQANTIGSQVNIWLTTP
jgi:hypothetical protein